MTRSMARTILGVVVGLAVTLVSLIAVEGFSMLVHPFPDGFRGTHEEICLHVTRYPPWVLAAVVPMWGGAAFSGVWSALRVGRGFLPAALVAILLLAALGMNLGMLPYPAWFRIAAMLGLGAGVSLAARSAARPADAAS